MSGVPYLYVNVIALCCFTLIVMTFLAAKKTPAIRAFIVVMFGFILWTGGSILMRLQVFPGVDFWYYVSVMALFSLALIIYNFVCSFVGIKGYFLKVLWSAGTFVLLAATALGYILKPPVMDTLPNGGVVFRYTMEWPVVIPYIFFAFIVFSIARIFKKIIFESGIRAPGVLAMIAGCVAVAIGNTVQIIPGNIFPWDTLSGIVFALLIIWALYKKRMFRMTLLISRTLLTSICALVFIVATVYFIEPFERVLGSIRGLGPTPASTITAVSFALLLVLIYALSKKLVDALFTREEQQARLLKTFSSEVSQSLDTGTIMAKLAAIVKSEIPVGHVYICLLNENAYSVKYSSEPLDRTTFSIPADSPCVRYLKSGATYLILSDFENDPLYLSMRQEEKRIIRGNAIACITALKDGDNIVGLALLSKKEKSKDFSYAETSFLEAVISIASIAVKNAGLYEQMYREARIDSLTGVYNYRFFMEKLNADFKACIGSTLALMFVDVDDFKLYNQLYGSQEGDNALRTIASIISLCVGENGSVFRHSGKVFAILLPHFDGRRAETLACGIKERMEAINAASERTHMKKITISCGICVSPYAAATAKELLDNTDLAVYNAKSAGKNQICFFKGAVPTSRKISTKAMEIIERGRSRDSAYQENSTAIFALTAAIDAKDHYTYQHSHNVAVYAAILATAAGLNEEQVSIVYEAALLHDIGKISIPERILSKTSQLTREEYDIIKGHLNSSIEMIRYLPSMDYVIPAAIGHHERWDGKGYPRGLSGQDIPILARCLALADAFDAMTTDRPYRKGMEPSFAAEQIEEGAGTQFDPELAEVFVGLVRSGELFVRKEGVSV